MQQRLSWNKPTFAIVLLAFIWNLILVIGVVFNAHFALTRAAGGQFTAFPLGIRVLYFFMTLMIFYQVWIFKLIFHADTVHPDWIVRTFFYVGVAGVLMNAISRSNSERWNSIPAAVIVWAFWYFGIKRNPELQ